jgi:hypothetical protein
MPFETPPLFVLAAALVAVLLVGVIIWRTLRTPTGTARTEPVRLYSVALDDPASAIKPRPRPVAPTPTAAGPVVEVDLDALAAQAEADARRAVEAPTPAHGAPALGGATHAPSGHGPLAHGQYAHGQYAHGQYAHGQYAHGQYAHGQYAHGQYAHGQYANGYHANGGSNGHGTAHAGDAALPPTKPRGVPVVPDPEDDFGGQIVRYRVPQDGTLQFLPGRLEVISGVDKGREVRFVHLPGSDGDVVTFGRSEGPPYRHIQLREATVSRNHARLRLEHGVWHLMNLSATNPVVLNDRSLDVGEEHVLGDGDRVEMGEVVFAFRKR